jgi:hypothetical protein
MLGNSHVAAQLAAFPQELVSIELLSSYLGLVFDSPYCLPQPTRLATFQANYLLLHPEIEIIN